MLVSIVFSVLIISVLAYFIGPKDEELNEVLKGCEELQEMFSEHIAVLDAQQEFLKGEREYLQTIGVK